MDTWINPETHDYAQAQSRVLEPGRHLIDPAQLVQFRRASIATTWVGGEVVTVGPDVPRFEGGMLVVEAAATALAWPSRPPAGAAPYFTTEDAPGVVRGQLARKHTRVQVSTPPNVFVGGGAVVGDDRPLCQWAIVEQDVASPQSVWTRLVWYRTSAPAGVVSQIEINLANGSVGNLVTPVGTTFGVFPLPMGPNGGKAWLAQLTTIIPTGSTVAAYAYSICNVGGSMFWHHRQVEQPVIGMPSPIVTTTGPATRAADSAVLRLSDPSTPIGNLLRDPAAGLANACYLRLMTPLGQWFGDETLGSRLHELQREKDLARVERLARQYATDALRPILDDGRARSITVNTERTKDASASGRMLLAIEVVDAMGVRQTFRFVVRVA